jgi:hypothetical protein
MIMEDKEMLELLHKFKKGEIKAEDLDQKTAERYLAFLKVYLRDRLDKIKQLDEDTARVNKEAEIIAQETKEIEEETRQLREENEEMAARIQKAIESESEDDETIRKILKGEE